MKKRESSASGPVLCMFSGYGAKYPHKILAVDPDTPGIRVGAFKCRWAYFMPMLCTPTDLLSPIYPPILYCKSLHISGDPSQIQFPKAHSDVCVPNLREEQQRNLEASIHTCTTRTIHYTRRRWSARGTWTCEIGSRACDETWKGNGRTSFRKGSLNINDRQTGRWMLLYSFRKGVQKSIFISSSASS